MNKLILICAYSTCASLCWAQGDTQSVVDCLQEKVAKARAFEIPKDTQIEFSYLTAEEVVPEDQLEKLDNASEMNPNSRAMARRARSENEMGGLRQQVTLYYGDSSKWRTSRDILTYSISPSIDLASNGGKGYWSLTSRQLQVASKLDDHTAKEGFHPEFFLQLCDGWLRALMFGVVWDIDADLKVTDVEIVGTRAIVQAVISGARFQITLARQSEPSGWDEANIVQVDVYDADGPQLAGGAVFDGWHYSDVLGGVVSSKQLTHIKSGAIESELVLVSAEPLRIDIDELVGTPRADGSDILRGVNTFTTINYLSGGRRSTIDDSSRKVLDNAKMMGEKGVTQRFIIAAIIISSVLLVLVVVIKKTGLRR